MKRVPSLPKINIPALSIKDILVTQTYVSTTIKGVAEELSIDTPLNIASSINEAKESLDEFLFDNSPGIETIHHNEHWISLQNNMHINQIEHMMGWLGIGVFCLWMHTKPPPQQDNKKLSAFISYPAIRKQIQMILIFLSCLFIRNIENAI
jgi:hypothetical protein